MPPTPMSRAVLGAAMAAAVTRPVAADPDPRPPAVMPSTGAPSSPTPPPPSTPTSESPQEDLIRISITIGEQRFQATLADTPAADDLVAQLPVTLDMVDHGGVEKTGPLPSPLSLDGQPEGADPDVGDLGYYAPGNDLVLYYGDQEYFPGIVILGHLDETAAQLISASTAPSPRPSRCPAADRGREQRAPATTFAGTPDQAPRRTCRRSWTTSTAAA